MGTYMYVNILYFIVVIVIILDIFILDINVLVKTESDNFSQEPIY